MFEKNWMRGLVAILLLLLFIFCCMGSRHQNSQVATCVKNALELPDARAEVRLKLCRALADFQDID